MSDGFGRDEKRELVRRLGAGDRPECPRCGEPLKRRRVPPREEVAYVRDRIWLVCDECGASGVVDRREVERERSEDEE